MKKTSKTKKKKLTNFSISVTETVCGHISVRAHNWREAIRIAKKQYYKDRKLDYRDTTIDFPEYEDEVEVKSKKASKKPKEAKIEKLKELPELVPGNVNVAFTPEELSNYAQLLSLMSHALEEMALSAAKVNDLQSFDILKARSQLSALLAGKLNAHYNIGESPSRDVH